MVRQQEHLQAHIGVKAGKKYQCQQRMVIHSWDGTDIAKLQTQQAEGQVLLLIKTVKRLSCGMLMEHQL